MRSPLLSTAELTGTVFAESEMSLFAPESVKEIKGSTESPMKGRPYISLTSSAFAPQEAFELSATDFTAGASYEVLVDEVPI